MKDLSIMECEMLSSFEVVAHKPIHLKYYIQIVMIIVLTECWKLIKIKFVKSENANSDESNQVNIIRDHTIVINFHINLWNSVEWSGLNDDQVVDPWRWWYNKN